MLQFETADTLIETYTEKINSLFSRRARRYTITSNKDLLARVWTTICQRSFDFEPLTTPYDIRECYDEHFKLQRQERSTRTDAMKILQRIPKKYSDRILASIYKVLTLPTDHGVRQDFLKSQHRNLQYPYINSNPDIFEQSFLFASEREANEYSKRSVLENVERVSTQLFALMGDLDNTSLGTLEGMLLMVIRNGDEDLANIILREIYPKQLLCAHLFHTHKLLKQWQTQVDMYDSRPSPF